MFYRQNFVIYAAKFEKKEKKLLKITKILQRII